MRHEDGHKVATPEQLKIWMNQTMEWINIMAVKDKFVQGIGLPFDNAMIVKPHNQVIAGPYGKAKETIGGIIIIKAKSVDEAVEFAKGCPVLQGDGNSVEVRRIASDHDSH